MAHEDAGHYAGKHPQGTIADPHIEKAVKTSASGSNITCSAATQISKELHVPMAKVGQTIDLLEFRITHCQLGLYGYGTPGDHGKNIATIDNVSPLLKKEIETALIDGRLHCKVAKEIADRLSVKKTEVTAACDLLKIKIKFCELGAF